MQVQRQEGPISAASEATNARIQRAERILDEIANEYAAKRAAGLVPTIPVPARTLLWQEITHKAHFRNGVRGKCVFGRDTNALCACTEFVKLKNQCDVDEETQACGECGHGGPWHRIMGSQNLARGVSVASNSERSMEFAVFSFVTSSEDSTCQLDIENQDEMLHAYTEEQIDSERHRTKSILPTEEQEVKEPQAIWQQRTAMRSSPAASMSKENKWPNTKLDRLLQAIQDLRASGFSEFDIEEQLRREFE
uniref:Uncharacterized protein AlNc14C2G305 n=1 Tax=Albugo laibachii Nc14 TaxID=890382 RepID=F0VZG7_9STRA|nr:conserved hypothetical protein [Albugo laibachii Nc14]|eukprot:CCA14197.1 conserved hypothetical protein [Albugo laibachii Nc14]